MGYKKLPFPNPLEKPKESKGLKLFVLCMVVSLVATFLALLVVGSNSIPNLMVTDGYCDKLIENASNYSMNLGLEYAVASITNEMIKCKTIPVNYAGYSYNLIAVECLNLTKLQEDINNE